MTLAVIAALSLAAVMPLAAHAAPTVPDPPTGVTASAPGNGSVQVSWTAPINDGGDPISSYTVTSSPDNITATTLDGSTFSIAVTGLTNGTSYTFTAVATNSLGSSVPSTPPSNSETPGTIPGAPTGVTATAGNASAGVSWTAPASNGGSPITGYLVTASPGGKTASTSGATSATVSGLTNGTSYTFTVVASNTFGPGPASAPSSPVTPATVPGAPTSVSATAGNASAAVTWNAPGSNGGSAITGYVVTSSPGGNTASTSGATSTSVPGLTNGTSYTFTVVAHNTFGPGPASAPSNSVTPATVPGAPTNVVATAGNASAGVTWAAPASNGGSSILSYKVTSAPGGFTATANGSTTSATVPGLTNNTITYTFTVTATNVAGTGPASLPSNGVTPTASVPSAPTSVVATAVGDGTAGVSWTAPSSDGGSPITSYTVTSSPEGKTASTANGTTTNVNVTGLTNGTPNTFTVVANNIAGVGATSLASNPVTTTGAATAPTAVVAGAGDSAAGVSWTAPASNGGSPITSYTVTSTPGGITFTTADGITTSAIVTGLTNGTPYTFTVIATNSVGPSPASSPSASVTPAPATVSSLFPATCPWNGCVGVVINGTNLFGATSVQFGTTVVSPCTTTVGGPCTIVSSKAIDVDAPNGSGIVDVRVISGAPTNITPIVPGDRFTYTTNCLPLALVAADNPSPQPVGTLITFTTTPAGCPSPVFTYWLRYPNGNWVNVRPWASSPVWRWTPATIGTYTLHVGANESGDSLKTFEGLAVATFVVQKATAGSSCTAAALNPPDKPSPQQSGTIITFTATAATCINPEFKFYVQATGGPWILGKNWGTNTYVWNTAGNGVTSYNVQVWARAKGSTAAYQAFLLTPMPYTLSPPLACIAPTTLTPNPLSPQLTGSIVTFTATTSTCSQPVFKFYVQAPGGPWILGKNWGTNTYIWITKGDARLTYNVVVWARQNGSKAAQESYMLIQYTLS